MAEGRAGMSKTLEHIHHWVFPDSRMGLVITGSCACGATRTGDNVYIGYQDTAARDAYKQKAKQAYRHRVNGGTSKDNAAPGGGPEWQWVI
jgi:hypothetical protein